MAKIPGTKKQVAKSQKAIQRYPSLVRSFKWLDRDRCLLQRNGLCF